MTRRALRLLAVAGFAIAGIIDLITSSSVLLGIILLVLAVAIGVFGDRT